MSFVAIAAGVVGLGGLALTAKGQSDQKNAINASNAQNAANFKEKQAADWRRYMLARGVNPGVTGGAVNAKLPYWAMVKPTTAGGTTGSFIAPTGA